MKFRWGILSPPGDLQKKINIADVLQRLIQRASLAGLICHPIDPALPCPVLQYADDTLILTRGDTATMLVLREILDTFSAATGLTINFHKSTFVPMNVDADTAAAMASALGRDFLLSTNLFGPSSFST